MAELRVELDRNLRSQGDPKWTPLPGRHEKHRYQLMFLRFNARTSLSGEAWTERDPWYEFRCIGCNDRQTVHKSKFGKQYDPGTN